MAQQTRKRFDVQWKDHIAYLNEKNASTGFDRHYLYHTAWAAGILSQTRPARHVDIGSSLYFCSLVSAFIPIDFYDYRPPNIQLNNLTCNHVDISNSGFESGSCTSLSCMHVVEHIGLGRYGDPIDPDGDLKAITELKRILAPGGLLLFVVPIGRPKLIFNGHRIYSYEQIMESFSDLVLKNFTLIPDGPADEGLVENPPRQIIDSQNYGCGCFCFTKTP